MKTTQEGIFENLKRMTGDETLDNLKKTGEYYSINGASSEVNDIVNHIIVAVRNNAKDEINKLTRLLATKDEYIKTANGTIEESIKKLEALALEVSELKEIVKEYNA